ncbi:MAG TPA: helix-hairpin-helix domain-containing protein [Holophaga sp.]|jgi:competence protein ComEA|nr:helix-hairpin-helix domain-containing protein [Holophaga sp.]
MFKTLYRSLVLCAALPLAAADRAPSHSVNLNTASVTELMQLPHVGVKTADRIVTFRKQHGGFRRIEEVMNVKGIGEKSFAKLRPYLTLGVPVRTAADAPARPAKAAPSAHATTPKR